MKILFLGDFLYDYNDIQPDIACICEYIAQNGLHTVINLETTLGEKGKPIKKGGPNIRSTDITFSLLRKMNTIAVTMANNHTMDYGEEALLDTCKRLEDNGIGNVGAGLNLEEAKKPFVINTDNRKLVVLNCGWDVEETVYATYNKPGCNPLDREKILSEITTIKESDPDSFIILIPHWGFEFNTYPMPCDIGFAHSCINHGCNLIIGHHPHVIQAKEIYNNSHIFYSLGNFYSGSHRSHFPTNFVNERYTNFCDYAIGVVLDTDSLKCREQYLKYDRETDTTVLLKEAIDLLPDITGIDYTSKDYITLVGKHKNNTNPILTLDERNNQKLIKKLRFKHKNAIRLRFLKSSSLGSKVYSILKQLAG